jgi:hypothetical protein
MSSYRSHADQIRGLLKIKAHVPDAEIEERPGDVPVLKRGNREICYAVGGYDLWIEGSPKEFNLDVKQAAGLLKLN